MIWLAFARRYAWILAAAALVAIILYGISAALDRAEQTGYRRATDAMAARVAKANESARAAEQAAQQRTHEVSQRYEQSISDLDGKYRAASAQLRRVRLCPAARAVQLPSADSTPGSFDESARDDRLPSQPAGDTRVDRLILLARDADGCAARLSALQSWVAETHNRPQ